MSETTVTAVAITQTEWRSLLRLGELRIACRRIHKVEIPPTPKERDRLFSWAPTTEIGDANDTLVIELVDNWSEQSRRHPSQPTEILVIELNSVSAHHAVNVESHAYFSDDAAKEGIELSEGRYESTWLGWVGQQESATYLAAAETLIRSFGIPVDLHRKRSDGYHWLDIIELARNSKISIKAKPRHIEDLLRSVRQISNAAAGVHSTASFTLAVNIEWVVARLGKDPLRKKGLRTVLEEALDVGRNVDWSIDTTSCEPVARAVEALAEAFPRSYTPDISPEMVVLTNRLIMAAKEQSLSPIDVSIAIGHLLASDGTESAATLCAAISGVLGLTMTRRLCRALGAINPTALEWS